MARYIFIILAAGFIGNMLAKKKGYDPGWWFVLCALFPFLVVVILLLPSKVIRESGKRCFYCSAVIGESKVCKYCGKEQPIDMVKGDSSYYEVK